MAKPIGAGHRKRRQRPDLNQQAGDAPIDIKRLRINSNDALDTPPMPLNSLYPVEPRHPGPVLVPLHLPPQPPHQKQPSQPQQQAPQQQALQQQDAYLQSLQQASHHGIPHPGLARAWNAAAPPPLYKHCEGAPSSEQQGVHPTNQESHSATGNASISALAAYSDMNAMLARLHMERVAAGARDAWQDSDNLSPGEYDDDCDL